MENAADALKIVLAIFIFSIGLVMLFNMASQAKETARILIAETDSTKYYDYYEEVDEETIDRNGNRIVTLKDIIPAIYRYSEENYGVTIINRNGEVVARFDLDTEQACNNWIHASDSVKAQFVIETKSTFEKANKLAENVGGNQIRFYEGMAITTKDNGSVDYDRIDLNTINLNEMTSLLQKLYGQVTSGTIRRDYYCYWIGTMGWTSQRIDSDLSGIDVRFSSTNIGGQATDNASQPGNHICCIKNGNRKGLIANFEGSRFTEYLIEVDRNSYITNDDESLFSFGEIMEPIKKELIYVENG